MKLRLTVCCRAYDLTQALVSGEVTPEGIDPIWIPFNVDSFWRMLSHGEFDVAETSMNTYLMARSEGAQVTAIPVFPHRRFRHSYIYLNRDAGVAHPEQLAGKRVGLPEYQITAAVWLRGILQDDHGLDPLSVHWFESRQAVRHPFNGPAGLQVERLPEGQNALDELLARGQLDAVIGPGVPDNFLRHSNVRRLFPDFKQVERDFYLRTGIFPIMHVIVIRNSVLEENKWVAASLLKAFQASKEACYRRMRDARLWALVWNRALYEEEREVFGHDPFPYGIEANRRTLDALIRYSHQQGLLKSPPESLESLFPAHLADLRYYESSAPGDA